jgi:hypothetical protein
VAAQLTQSWYESSQETAARMRSRADTGRERARTDAERARTETQRPASETGPASA